MNRDLPGPLAYIAIISLLFICFALSQAAADERNVDFIPVILSMLSSHRSSPPPGIGHDKITHWEGTSTCLNCHRKEAEEVFSSVHYQWLGSTPYMDNGPVIQGKLDMGVNSYCINITGNWKGCSSCHVGLGARPTETMSNFQLLNIDCLICHQDNYSRIRVGESFEPDLESMNISMLEAARTVHRPTRKSCLRCHAKGGGGDNFKRGDMALAHEATNDRNFDVHMASTGGNLLCMDCHITNKHRMAGRGSDLRVTDLDVDMQCTQCHSNKDTIDGHSNRRIGYHVEKVACQSCHIDRYAKNAEDTIATEETEIHRDWQLPHTTSSGVIHPTPTLSGDLYPQYKWWNGRSSSYLLFDDAVPDSETSRIPTSRPTGSIHLDDSQIFPFKYKTATQPLAENTNVLIALDTSIYFTTGDVNAAIVAGLINMGYDAGDPYRMIETDTYQLLTHEISPADRALGCIDCHDSTQRIDLQNNLGYILKGEATNVCTQCHRWIEVEEEKKGYEWIHKEHVEEERYDCSWCHDFTRPARGLRTDSSSEEE